MLRKFLLASAGALTLTGTALAADLAAATPAGFFLDWLLYRRLWRWRGHPYLV